MDQIISFERLSGEIREEIQKFHEQQAGSGMDLGQSMNLWFKKHFDNWLLEKYGQEGVNKRQHFRLDVEMPLRVVDTIVEASGDDQQANELVGNVLNISRGGLYFHSPVPLEISTIVRVQVDLSSIEKGLENIQALAMVMRVDRLGEGDYGIGVMFSSIYDEDRSALDVFLLKNLSNYLYSS
jgi:hypothetical protein